MAGSAFLVGGIQSFSGADAANPIDAESGQTTVSGTNHDTPSITTSTANTMLVTSHTYASSQSWTPQAGLTESFDRPSGTASATGQSITGTRQAQAAAGATGTKRSTAASSADVGNTHILALRRFTNAAPTVGLTSPANGATFIAPASITLAATAADSDGTIQKVEFFQGGTTLIGTATSAPYSVTWGPVAAGSYSVTAVATDNTNATATSTPVSVTVIPNALPTVSITSPSAGANFTAPANITVSATALDSDGTIQKVEFFQGGTNLIATLTAPPYSFTWTAVPQGTYSLTAVATDNLNGTRTSAPVNVTVNRVPALNFVQVDHLNTPRMIADATGATVWKWDQQEPFGNNVPDENPSGIGAFEFPPRFPGQYADKETALDYNVRRDYDAAIGRYVESDPIRLKGGLNTYGYVGGGPLRYVDPLGLVRWDGTVLGGSVQSGAVELYTLISECKCNKRVYVSVRAEYFGLSVGWPASYTGQSVTFNDANDCPLASMFEGFAGKASVGVAIGVGVNAGMTTLGRANSDGWSAEMGLEYGASLSIIGRSTVISASEECCR